MFRQQGRLDLPAGVSEESVIEATLEAEPEDVVALDDGSLEVITSPGAYSEVKDALAAAGLEPERGGAPRPPRTDVGPQGDPADRHLDDVQNVYTNAEFADDVLDQLD